MSTLALDLATQTGWAIADDKGKIVESGTWVLEGDECEKLSMLASNLRYTGMTDTVVIERPWVRGPMTLFLMGLRGVAMACAGEWGSEFFEYAPATVKKAVTGSGKADKMAVVNFVERISGRKVDTYDEADAIAVALCHLRRAKRGRK